MKDKAELSVSKTPEEAMRCSPSACKCALKMLRKLEGEMMIQLEEAKIRASQINIKDVQSQLKPCASTDAQYCIPRRIAELRAARGMLE
ncbi:unnamed protein product [Phytomonas sp. Hart1]|nr:unnamed protein product [Phytomonas sp. Hart1]|eukprot:CCW69286.1 unnamed protein product [Phytomonas sp. isolate Hart1]